MMYRCLAPLDFTRCLVFRLIDYGERLAVLLPLCGVSMLDSEGGQF